MKPCGVLLFLVVLWKITEPVAVVEVQAVKTAHLFDFLFPCREAVLPDTIGFRLKRVKSDIIPVLYESFKDSLFGIFLSEPIGADWFFIALWG